MKYAGKPQGAFGENAEGKEYLRHLDDDSGKRVKGPKNFIKGDFQVSKQKKNSKTLFFFKKIGKSSVARRRGALPD